MRIDLGQLAVQGLLLELPGNEAGARDKRVRIESAEQLRGVLVQTASGFQLSNVVCPRLLVAKLDWLFGKLGLRAEQLAELTGLAVEASTMSGELELELKLSGLGAAKLELSMGNLQIVARVEGRGLVLQSGPAVGVLRAQHALFSTLEVRTASLSVKLPALEVEGLLVDWGGDDFRLEALKLEGGELTLEQAGAKLHGDGLHVLGLSVVGANVQVAHASLARLDLAAELPAPTSQPAASQPTASTPAVSAPPIFDYELLNGLAGRLNVDVAVDLAVPIIGRRRATHELRIVLDEGALDYRELENNLARLEDSLLDFSVRDGALVLERGLPLISTRGRGKPIVIWDLSPQDLALAQDRRVRLAVLPRARLAGSSGQSEPPPPPDAQEEGSSGFRLRHLSLQDVDAALQLPATGTGQGALRELTFASLTVRGTVHHDPEGQKREGRIQAALSELRATVAALPLAAQQLAAALEVASLRDIDILFEDVRPRRASAVVEGVVIRSLSLA
jgi:hypothetical protein